MRLAAGLWKQLGELVSIVIVLTATLESCSDAHLYSSAQSPRMDSALDNSKKSREEVSNLVMLPNSLESCSDAHLSSCLRS